MQQLIHFTLLLFFFSIPNDAPFPTKVASKNPANTSNERFENSAHPSANAAYFKIENFTNPKFVKVDDEKAMALIADAEKQIKDNEDRGRKTIFPKHFKVLGKEFEIYIIKMSVYQGRLVLDSYYHDDEVMDPDRTTYFPQRDVGNIAIASNGIIPDYVNELRKGQEESIVILKAKNLNQKNPQKWLVDWVKNNLEGVSSIFETKLKVNVSSNNELAFCLGIDKIHTYKEWKGKLIKIRTLDTDENLVAFSSSGVNRYCTVTSKTTPERKSPNYTNIHLYKGSYGEVETKSLKIWDEHQIDELQERPYPTLDYANGEYLFQYYLTMWEAAYNRHLHSGSFRLKIKEDGSTVEPRRWQTSHTFGMDALHDGTDWVSVYSTDGDYRLRHPGVFIDKVDKKEKALLFNSPQKWSDPKGSDAHHGAMNYFYTGLGGIAYDGNAYGVVFNNPKMKSAPARLPQNVGFVYVNKAFEPTIRRGSGNSRMIDPTKNLSNAGETDNVTIYTEKMNTVPVNYKRKVKWLTDYTSLEEGYAKNADIVAIGDKFVILWEKWAMTREITNSWGKKEPVWEFQSTEAVVVDRFGTKQYKKSLGKYLLNDWDDLHVQNGKVVWVTYHNANFYVNKLDIHLKHEKLVYPQP